jgi:hypothetical protein
MDRQQARYKPSRHLYWCCPDVVFEVRMRTLTKPVLILSLGIGGSLALCAQQSASHSCQLKNYGSGDRITVTGTVNATPHDLFLHLPGCQEPVVLAFPSELQEKEKAGLRSIQKDENVENLSADLGKGSTKSLKVTLSGRLDVAKPIPEGARVQLGMIFNAVNEFVGIYGFGHPAPVYKYRVVLQQVESEEVIPVK